MEESVSGILAFVVLLSLLENALSPCYWVPFVVFKREQRWSFLSTALVMTLAALARTVSSVLIGVFLGSPEGALADPPGPTTGFVDWAGTSLLLWKWLLGPFVLLLLALWLIVRGAGRGSAPVDQAQQTPTAEETPSPAKAGAPVTPPERPEWASHLVAVLGLAALMFFSPSLDVHLFGWMFFPFGGWATAVGVPAVWCGLWLVFEASIVCVVAALLSGVGRSWSKGKARVVHGTALAVVGTVWLLM